MVVIRAKVALFAPKVGNIPKVDSLNAKVGALFAGKLLALPLPIGAQSSPTARAQAGAAGPFCPLFALARRLPGL